jgi:hypothetical protein
MGEGTGIFTIGTDIEYFIKKGDSFISGIPYIEGTKHSPTWLPCGGNVQRDNVAVEFATAPRRTEKAFLNQIGMCVKGVKAILPQGLRLIADQAADFDAEELDHPEAKAFGCEPDFNAWLADLHTCSRPPDAADGSLRSCGAHVHVGYVEKSGNSFLKQLEGKKRMIRMMDATLGLWSTLVDNSNSALLRKTLYGKAGSFRPTSYGVEYRTLSNFWAKHPMLQRCVYHLTKDALKACRRNVDDNIITALGGTAVQNVINYGDQDTASEMLDIVDSFLSPKTRELISESLRMHYEDEAFVTTEV